MRACAMVRFRSSGYKYGVLPVARGKENELPKKNCFRHQRYSAAVPDAPYEIVCPSAPPPVDSPEFADALRTAGERFRRAGVAAIYLIHGTFAGTGAWTGQLQRLLPGLGRTLRQQEKRLVDSFVGEMGNYTGDFARRFEAAINEPSQTSNAVQTSIPVRRFLWSSENNHIGRAHAAIRLIDELDTAEITPDQRLLLCGHSHAGNVLALMTNLLAGNQATRSQFLAAARGCPVKTDLDEDLRELSRRIEDRLMQDEKSPLAASLDVVTLGTPIRYGWDTNGCANLLHFMNHRPASGLPDYQARVPQTLEEFRRAAQGDFGDYVQQTFVAGTNLPPNFLNWRARRADRQLHKLLESEHQKRDLWERLNAGPRVAADGTTLLVDYAHGDPEGARQLAGHGVYTMLRWLPFHTQQIAKRFYSHAHPTASE
jgi:hypothetical protein